MNIIKGLLCKPTVYIKSMASLVGAYLLKHNLKLSPPAKGYRLNIQSKASLVEAYLLKHNLKLSPPAKGYRFPSLACLYPSHPPKPEQTSTGEDKQTWGRGCRLHLPTPGGTPKTGTCSSERRAGIVSHW